MLSIALLMLVAAPAKSTVPSRPTVPARPAATVKPEPVPAPEVEPAPAAAPVAVSAPAPTLSPPPASGGPAQPAVALSDFAVVGAGPEVASALNGVAANELSRLGVFKVTTADTTRALLGAERQRQLLGCGEACPSLDLKTILDTDYLVTGKVTRLAGAKGGLVTLELTLLDARASNRIASEVTSKATEAELVGQVQAMVLKLMSKVLAGRQGSLVVAASETGAAVKLDGTIVGTTPLDGKSALAAGPHLLQVEKDGFVASSKEVRIAPDEVHEESVKLVPSPDTIAAYEGRSRKMRVGAWVTTAAAIAGVATFVGFQLRGSALFGSPSSPGTFEYHRAFLTQGIEIDESGDHRAEANRIKAQIQTAQTVSYIGAGVGAAAAITSAYLWIAGEDPGRYVKYKDLKVVMAPGPMSLWAMVWF